MAKSDQNSELELTEGSNWTSAFQSAMGVPTGDASEYGSVFETGIENSTTVIPLKQTRIETDGFVNPDETNLPNNHIKQKRIIYKKVSG